MRTDPGLTIAILADDLSSAGDGAVPFVERGLSASIGRQTLPLRNCAVVAVDSGSRSSTSAQAMNRVARLTSQLAGRSVIYKTVDSTLRGHVTAELEACFLASGRRSLVFAPAFPDAGRTTVNGIQLVDGVPVSESSYGNDPVHPARHSALVDLIPACISNVTLLDATTQLELDEQIARIENPESVLWVGSPGMAMSLSRRLVPEINAMPTFIAIDGDALVVVGSANARSHRQADRLQTSERMVLLRGPAVREADPAVVLQRLAQNAAKELRSTRFGALIATGGDTMEAILDLLGVREIEVVQELDPGFPLARAVLDDGRSLLLAMKAGGFGSDDALSRAVERICGTFPHFRKNSP
jgi:uncharacterized protein YgbK (DUF1537 family)